MTPDEIKCPNCGSGYESLMVTVTMDLVNEPEGLAWELQEGPRELDPINCTECGEYIPDDGDLRRFLDGIPMIADSVA